MSENTIPQNETAASDAPTAEDTATEAATEAATNEAETTETKKTETAATSAVIKIEGQEIPLAVAIAADDTLLKTALSPHYPSIKNANVSRETRAGQMIVSIVKRAEHKGVCSGER